MRDVVYMREPEVNYTGIEEWRSFSKTFKNILSELEVNDPEEINDAFYKDIEFGTGGMRGLMGVGPNRINEITIKKVSLALAKLLLNKYTSPTIVVGYDTRFNSRDFSRNVVEIMTQLGIKTYLFSEPIPTPILSYAVRKCKCSAGIMITASHNTKNYNGYKVYDHTGCQILPDYVKEIKQELDKITNKDVSSFVVDKSIEEIIGTEIIDEYISELEFKHKESGLRITYSPLHGAGLLSIKKVLKDFDLNVVKEQTSIDGNFSTVISPNPEEPEAMKMAIVQAVKQNSDLVFATDPDCDRLGVSVLHQGTYRSMTGNQVGAIIIDYLVNTLNIQGENNVVIKTIVTSSFGTNIAERSGYEVINTLTGFKYIGDIINKLEESKDYNFVFGYEESYGYLANTLIRDKDAISTALIIAIIADRLKTQGKTLIDRLEELYSLDAFYFDALNTIQYEGEKGAKKIQSIMDNARKYGKNLLPGIETVEDYLIGVGPIPKENVIKFHLIDGSWFAMRPSGTEPKIKFYFSIKSDDEKNSKNKLNQIWNELKISLDLRK